MVKGKIKQGFVRLLNLNESDIFVEISITKWILRVKLYTVIMIEFELSYGSDSTIVTIEENGNFMMTVVL